MLCLRNVWVVFERFWRFEGIDLRMIGSEVVDNKEKGCHNRSTLRDRAYLWAGRWPLWCFSHLGPTNSCTFVDRYDKLNVGDTRISSTQLIMSQHWLLAARYGSSQPPHTRSFYKTQLAAAAFRRPGTSKGSRPPLRPRRAASRQS